MSEPAEPSPTPAPQPTAVSATEASAPQPEPPAPPEASTPAAKPPPSTGRKLVRKLVTDPFGKLGGVVIGAVIGMAVEAGVDSTGLMGPGLEDLLAKQADGFALIESKLDSLKDADSLDEARALASEIETQLAQQQASSQRLADELRGARQEIDRLRAVALDTSGGATGADFWLKPGESISVGSRGNTFAVQGFTYSNRTESVNANVNGVRQRMGVGDIAKFETADGTYQVVYKLTEPRADGRVGFDLIKPTAPE